MFANKSSGHWVINRADNRENIQESNLHRDIIVGLRDRGF